jgi:hypothetical protein
MNLVTKSIAGAGAALALTAGAAPALAQYYGYEGSRYEQDRDRDTAARVVAGLSAVTGAVLTATQGGYYDPRYGNGYYGQRDGYGDRYGRGFEAQAVNACSYEAQRRFGGYRGARVNVRDVQFAHRDRLRVLGAVDVDSYGYDRYDRYDRYNRYDRRDGYNRGRVAFSCDVRFDGRVTRFRTHNYDW